jgi:ElaB/YqjD/DUF883 family membrane-anchored ribosome-binding protein
MSIKDDSTPTNTMKQAILFSVSLGCLLTYPLMAKANSSVDQILQEVNQLDQEANQLIQRSRPAAQNYQNYVNNLYRQCMGGNRNACAEHGNQMQQQSRHLDHVKQQQDEFYRNRKN